MFPYRDDNPTLATPIVTIAVIAANCLAWAVVQGAGSEPALTQSVCTLGLIPGELLGNVPAGTPVPMSRELACVIGPAGNWWTPLTSMFLHGGWLHLLGNMWFLWLFGNNVEDSMGRLRFVAFYLLCGFAAAAAQTAFESHSRLPMVGASGAISGVMGAYVVLYPRVRVHLLIFLGFFVTTVTVPAFVMLGYWLLLQLLGGATAVGERGGTAFWAHVGGFVAGVALIPLFKDRDLVDAHRRAIQQLQWRRA